LTSPLVSLREYRPPRSSEKSRRGSLPVKVDRARGTLDAKKHPDGLIGVPSVHLDGKGWRLHWEKRGRELSKARGAFHWGMGLGLNRVVPAWGMENNRNKRRPPIHRGIVMEVWLFIGSA